MTQPGEAKAMVRRLIAWAESRIANSPVQIGAQACTQLLACREICGIYALVNRDRVSPVQVVTRMSTKTPQNTRKSRSI